jgi:CheY-like chemotaxis protein
MTRILVVDDEPDTLNVMRLFLEIGGFQSLTTYRPTEAIQLAEVEPPDCIMLDVMMPDLDGFSLCKMMRANPVTANLPIMFVTAYSAKDIEHRRLESGGDLVLSKPFGLDEMTNAIQKVMALRPIVHMAPKTGPLSSPAIMQNDGSVLIRQNSKPEVYVAAIQKLLVTR